MLRWSHAEVAQAGEYSHQAGHPIALEVGHVLASQVGQRSSIRTIMRRSAILVELWDCVIFSFQQAGILLPWAEIGQNQSFN